MNYRIIIISLTLAAALPACSDGDENTLRFSGIMDVNTIRVSAETPGRVLERQFDEGYSIRKGDTLVILETEKLGYQLEQNEAVTSELEHQHRSAVLALSAARLKRDNVKTKYRRFEALLKQNAATQQSVDDLRTQYEAAEAELSSAEAAMMTIESKKKQVAANRGVVARQMSDGIVVSPLDGTVIIRYIDAGEFLGPGAPVCDIAYLDEMWTKIYIAEPDLPSVRLGQKMQVLVDGIDDLEIEGIVTWISAEAEFTPKEILTEETRTSLVFAAKVTVANPDGILKIGMPITVTANAAQTSGKED